MLGSKCEGILIGWDSVSHISTHSCIGQVVDQMVVRSIQSITFVIPAQVNIIVLTMHSPNHSEAMNKTSMTLTYKGNICDQNKLKIHFTGIYKTLIAPNRYGSLKK